MRVRTKGGKKQANLSLDPVPERVRLALPPTATFILFHPQRRNGSDQLQSIVQVSVKGAGRECRADPHCCTTLASQRSPLAQKASSLGPSTSTTESATDSGKSSERFKQFESLQDADTTPSDFDCRASSSRASHISQTVDLGSIVS